ncbi:hypothetical protein SXCC_03067 [Gluconacetobacter sp. SXCC-1]|nr:hypothetical protein SXCC_03067 [Gluconacetobacter sp. SXCC-1]
MRAATNFWWQALDVSRACAAPAERVSARTDAAAILKRRDEVMMRYQS